MATYEDGEDVGIDEGDQGKDDGEKKDEVRAVSETDKDGLTDKDGGDSNKVDDRDVNGLGTTDEVDE